MAKLDGIVVPTLAGAVQKKNEGNLLARFEIRGNCDPVVQKEITILKCFGLKRLLDILGAQEGSGDKQSQNEDGGFHGCRMEQIQVAGDKKLPTFSACHGIAAAQQPERCLLPAVFAKPVRPH